ncbi:hypothetical protein ST47_g860 [Ascochyta rabiei]|uniref:Enoyl reductase (ER) domain-containing protein n=1 Tax=Didymella rabiei TaxID=5454 RepID=A0A163LPL1_DIDRA|nr:hypothetical protein ST47_g860 [Ascochyta rabiei]
MRAAVITENRTLAIVDRPAASPAPDSVRIRVAFCGICGTDLHVRVAESFVGNDVAGMVLGHEFAGTIVEVGADVDGWTVGDRVAGWPCIPCGVCELCIAGQVQVCQEKIGNGVGTGGPDGALAEFVDVRADRVFALPDTLSDEHAALAEPLATALRAVRQGEVGPGDRVAVIGAGPVGLMTALALRATGTDDVLVVEVNDGRAEAAREFGFRTCRPEELADQASAVLGGAPTVIFECAGHESALPLAIDTAHPLGRIVAVGVLFETVAISSLAIIGKELRIIGSYAHTTQDFANAIELLAARSIPADRLITGRVALEDATRAFDELVDPATSHIKILLHP